MSRFIFVNFSLSHQVIFSVINVVQAQFPSRHTVSEDPEHLIFLLLCFKLLLQAIRKTQKQKQHI